MLARGSPVLLTRDSSKIQKGFVLNPSLTLIYNNHVNIHAFIFPGIYS